MARAGLVKSVGIPDLAPIVIAVFHVVAFSPSSTDSTFAVEGSFPVASYSLLSSEATHPLSVNSFVCVYQFEEITPVS